MQRRKAVAKPGRRKEPGWKLTTENSIVAKVFPVEKGTFIPPLNTEIRN